MSRFNSGSMSRNRSRARLQSTEQMSTPGTSTPLPATPRSLLSIANLSLAEISNLLALATELQAEPHAIRVRRLEGRRVALLFYESSTRTRTSFELAAKSLGAITTLVSDKSSSIEKGESLHDTGLTLRALGAECIILRSNFSGAPNVLARSTNLPVLNAGDGMHEHPSQALLDLRTILEHFNLPTTSPPRPSPAKRSSSPATSATPASPVRTQCSSHNSARASSSAAPKLCCRRML